MPLSLRRIAKVLILTVFLLLAITVGSASFAATAPARVFKARKPAKLQSAKKSPTALKSSGKKSRANFKKRLKSSLGLKKALLDEFRKAPKR